MMNRRIFLTSTAASASVILYGFPAYAAKDPVFARRGLAIRGYDPVAYFTQNKPVKGSQEHSLDWNGSTWRFSSAEHKALFENDPEKYAPQFGGYCSYAVSEGYTASTVPEAWDIVDGKLYLNYSLSVRNRWLQNRDVRITNGHNNWPDVLN